MKVYPCPRIARLAGLAPLAFLSLSTMVLAESGTWLNDPTSADWNTAVNWSSGTVPDGASDTASFDLSNQTGVSLSAPVTVEGVVFNPGASGFTITCPAGQSLSVEGSGVDNQSNVPQTLSASGGSIEFSGTAKAGKVTLTADNGGSIKFSDQAMGGQASVELASDGTLDITGTPSNGQTAIGSLEGAGQVLSHFERGLEVGANNKDTTFSGVIHSGNLIKTGSGTLTLTAANAYARTAVRGGTLMVANTSGSATGGSRVRVFGGTLAGTGRVGGKTTIGGGGLGGGFLSPGINGVGNLHFGEILSFHSDAVYNCELDTNTGHVDMVSAQQVSISSAAQFNLILLGNGTLPVGMILTVIDDRAPDPCGRCRGGNAIHGRFGNLADDSIFAAGNNSFHVSYEGGNGNDLTLTVVE